MREPALSILVLTEDSGKQGQPTVDALARSLLRLIDPQHDPEAVRLEPLAEEHLQTVRANHWKSRKPEDRPAIVDLRRRLATHLTLKTRPGFVLFHVDGDRRWAERDTSENHEKFRSAIEKPVRKLLEKRNVPPETQAAAMSRLFLLMPFYSIESWLYQNTRQAIRICHEHYAGSHVAQFEQWQEDRTLLDEVHKPKEAVPLRDRHNRELAEFEFPAPELDSVAKSFATTVAHLRTCPALTQALAQTHAP